MSFTLRDLNINDLDVLPRIAVSTSKVPRLGSIAYNYPDQRIYVSNGQQWVATTTPPTTTLPAIGIPGALATDARTGKVVQANSITGRFD